MAIRKDWYCIRCGHECKSTYTRHKVGNFEFDAVLNLDCENCEFSWKGKEDHAPIKPVLSKQRPDEND